MSAYTGPERRKDRPEHHGFQHVVGFFLPTQDIREFVDWLEEMMRGPYIIMPSHDFLRHNASAYPGARTHHLTMIRCAVGCVSASDAVLVKLRWG